MEQNKTTPFLTKNEKTNIIGVRASQICVPGCEIYVDAFKLGLTNPIDIALKEFEENKIPFVIRRPLSRCKSIFEDIKLNDLIH
jgi:DNA-directed RNA polymerase subunit K/omega